MEHAPIDAPDDEIGLFEFDPDPTFPFTAEIETASGRKGKLHLVGKHMGRQAFVDYCAAGKGTPDVEFIAGLLAGWNARHGDYSPARLAHLLDTHQQHAARAIFTAYSDALAGVERGN